MRDRFESRRNFLGAGAAVVSGAFALTDEVAMTDPQLIQKSGIKIRDIKTARVQANLDWHLVRIYTTTGPIIDRGVIGLSNEPGLGVELNEEVCRAHPDRRATYFE